MTAEDVSVLDLEAQITHLANTAMATIDGLQEELRDQIKEVRRLGDALLWIASMRDEHNEWDAVELFHAARAKAIDACGDGSSDDVGSP